MKTPINVTEIKQKIDYPSLAKEITTLSQEGALKRPNPIAELLNPVKEALLAARQNSVSIPALAKFLKQRGVPVSDTSLRRYMREQARGTNPRHNSRSHVRAASHVAAIRPPSVVTVNPRPSTNADTPQENRRNESLSPLAEQAHEKSRAANVTDTGRKADSHPIERTTGPRIADPKTI
jgi:hypothetical protein